MVEDPSDLTGPALAISAYLEAWEDRDGHEEGAAGHDGGSPASTSLCLHSLLDVLEIANLAHVFRFLHVSSGLLRRPDVTSHVHLDPKHDDVTVNTLRVLFDAVVRVEPNGSVTVDSR